MQEPLHLERCISWDAGAFLVSPSVHEFGLLLLSLSSQCTQYSQMRGSFCQLPGLMLPAVLNLGSGTASSVILLSYFCVSSNVVWILWNVACFPRVFTGLAGLNFVKARPYIGTITCLFNAIVAIGFFYIAKNILIWSLLLQVLSLPSQIHLFRKTVAISCMKFAVFHFQNSLTLSYAEREVYNKVCFFKRSFSKSPQEKCKCDLY